jgi:SAM-dependent methyltransferase
LSSPPIIGAEGSPGALYGSSVVTRTVEIPMPPRELRELIGQPDTAGFENPTGALVYPYLPASAYEAVFDFGCGCGRVARQLMLQNPRPKRYVGIDLHRGMVAWCRENLTPLAPEFEFHHHDIFAPGLNPTGTMSKAPFPVGDGEFSLVQAYSVFTHLTEGQTEHYLREVSRILRRDGYVNTTWFLFEKRYFPMMQDFQNTLFINDVDPTNAVIYDRSWLLEATRAAGFAVCHAIPPAIRGFQWTIVLSPIRPGVEEIDLPEDKAPFGREPPPLLRERAASLGLR